MTELYLRPMDRGKSRVGCFIMSGLLAVALVAVGWYLFRGDRAPTSDEAGQEAAVEQAGQSTQADRPADQPAARPTPAGDPGIALLMEAQEAQKADRLLEARDAAWRLLAESQNTAARAAAEELLSEVNILLTMTPRMSPEKTEYTISRGDSISRIADKFDTTVELVQRGNNISGSLIRVGDRLRVFSAEFEVHINKTINDLVVMANGQFFKRYRVGTGQFGTTPVGRYVLVERIKQPTWWKDGRAIPYGHPDNLLGTHYLKLDVPGYGIHGTWEPDSIGFQSSAGCVRLLNSDVEELFVLLPVGTPVFIEE